MLTNFKNSITIGLFNKLSERFLSYFPSRLKHVATLPRDFLLRTRSTFCKLLMVFVGVSKFGKMTSIMGLRLAVSVSTVPTTSTTSASQSLSFLVGQIFVWQNTMTCLSLRQEHSLADVVSTLQPEPSGMCFYHRPTDTSENYCCRVYCFTLHFTLI